MQSIFIFSKRYQTLVASVIHDDKLLTLERDSDSKNACLSVLPDWTRGPIDVSLSGHISGCFSVVSRNPFFLVDSFLKHQMITPLEEVRSYEAVRLDVIFDFMRKIINFAKYLNSWFLDHCIFPDTPLHNILPGLRDSCCWYSILNIQGYMPENFCLLSHFQFSFFCISLNWNRLSSAVL